MGQRSAAGALTYSAVERTVGISGLRRQDACVLLASRSSSSTDGGTVTLHAACSHMRPHWYMMVCYYALRFIPIWFHYPVTAGVTVKNGHLKA